MTIPKVIYQTWKTKDLTENLSKVRNNIKSLNPEYEIIIYDDNDIDQFMKNECDKFTFECYSKLNVGATRADLWRYCILYKYGGVYLDIDAEITGSLDELIENDQCIITRESNLGIFNNWIMIFQKGHPILEKTIYNCCINIMNKSSNDVCYLTGPRVFTNSINQILISLYIKDSKDIKDNNLYYEDDNILNIILNNKNNKIRCKFYKIDMDKYARYKHKYADELYQHNIYWRNETKIFKEESPADYLKLFKVYNFDKKTRLGKMYDGGYVIGDIDTKYDCYISAGISNEESFTKDFLDRYKIEWYNCYAFDGTINNYPYEYTKNILFLQKNINSHNDNNNTNLTNLIEKYNNIFLKMDIEGGEYPWLLSLDQSLLNKFVQIVIEFHGITGNEWNCSIEDKMKCIEKLSKTHYLIHAHGNNYGNLIDNIPDVIELTYLNKNYFNYEPELNKITLPIANLDYPNNSLYNDFNLNFYPFVNKTQSPTLEK